MVIAFVTWLVHNYDLFWSVFRNKKTFYLSCLEVYSVHSNFFNKILLKVCVIQGKQTLASSRVVLCRHLYFLYIKLCFLLFNAQILGHNGACRVLVWKFADDSGSFIFKFNCVGGKLLCILTSLSYTTNFSDRLKL